MGRLWIVNGDELDIEYFECIKDNQIFENYICTKPIVNKRRAPMLLMHCFSHVLFSPRG